MARSNNIYDFVRLSAALFVVYGHGFALLNLPSPGLMGVGIHTFGVLIFFCISGYLITDSWLRDPDLKRFLLRRALRIFPALIAVVLICMLVAGPALTTLSLWEYFGHGTTRAYLKNIWLRTQYALPGVFASNPYPGAVNGSLWSLPIEFFCYLIVAAAGMLALWIGRARLIMVFVTAIVLIGAAVVQYRGAAMPRIIIYGTDLAQALAVAPYFLVAACCRMFRDKISFNLALGVALVFVPTVFLAGTSFMTPLLWLTLPYAVIAFCESSVPMLSNAGRWGDMSYGVYLYSFPVQQVLAHFMPMPINVYLYIFLATVLTLPLAFISWHTVEKRALRLKPGARVNIEVKDRVSRISLESGAKTLP
jgi:peptidoglycan/LPS O-acetylase OafA/YrhL